MRIWFSLAWKKMTISFRKKRETGWTAVDAGEDCLVGVTVMPPQAMGSKPRVVKCGSISGGRFDVATLTGLAKIISVPGCRWTLPLQHKTYNILVVPEPSVKPDEIDQSLRWAIGSMLDYPVDNASIAWMRIPTDNLIPNRPHEPQLYVMAARYEIIVGYNELFQKARIPLKAIDVRETAQRNIAALAEKPREGVGLLRVSPQGVQFTVNFNGELYLDRFFEESLFSASDDVDSRTRACERIVLQVQRSLDFISRNMSFIDVNRILLAPTSDGADLGDLISRHLPIAVEELDLASLFDISLTPELARKEAQSLHFSALGAALRFMKSTV